MEKQTFQGSQNSSTKLFLILSYISWIAASVNNWISLNWLYSKKHRAVWNIYIFLDDEGNVQVPIQMDYLSNYIFFNFTFAIIFIGCIVFFYTTLIKKDQEVINGMTGKFSRFHFIPLLLALGMSILGELDTDTEDSESYYPSDKAGLPISLLGLISIIFIYIFTDLKSNNWWANFSLRNGTFSCLIVLFWYNFCYDIYCVRVADRKVEEDEDWLKGCGIFFSIIFGLACFIFSFIFKDIMISFLNVIIYFGMTKYYFGYPLNERSTKQYNNNGDGVVDVIILVFSIILFFYLIIEKSKDRNAQIKNQIFQLQNIQNQIIVTINGYNQIINSLRNQIANTSNNPPQ